MRGVSATRNFLVISRCYDLTGIVGLFVAVKTSWCVVNGSVSVSAVRVACREHKNEASVTCARC